MKLPILIILFYFFSTSSTFNTLFASDNIDFTEHKQVAREISNKIRILGLQKVVEEIEPQQESKFFISLITFDGVCLTINNRFHYKGKNILNITDSKNDYYIFNILKEVKENGISKYKIFYNKFKEIDIYAEQVTKDVIVLVGIL